MTARATRSLRARLALTTALAGLLALPGMAAGQISAVGTATSTSTNLGPSTSTNTAVVASQPSISLATTDANNTTVGLNAKSTVINWANFSIATGQSATFNNNISATQPTVAVLNRVAAGTTNIQGSLTGTNGVEVWISNPNGIIISSGANINTNGLVLTTLDVAEADFTGSATSYHVSGGGIGNISTAGTTGATITTNNGKLLLIAPAVQLTNTAATYNAGTGAAGFVTATDVTLSAPGSPLGITVNAGTAVISPLIAQQVAGTVTAGQAYFLMTAQDTLNALLEIDASVTTATAAGGVVVLGGPGLAQGAASTGAGAGGGNVGVTLNGTMGVTGTGAGINVAVSKGTLGGTTTSLSASGPIVINSSGANATIGLTAAALNGGSVNLNAGTGDVNVASVASSGDYQVTGANFLGGSLSPTLTGGATSTFAITDTAGGLTLTTPLTAPGNLLINAINGGALTLPATLTATGGALGLTGAGGIVLAANTVLNGGTQVSVNSAVNATAAGSQSLTVNTTGATSFAGTIGATTPLSSLTTDMGGTTTLNANVTTTGAQTYNDNVTLGAALALNAGAGNISFNGTLGGPFDLNVNSTGTSSFGTVGAGTGNALASLTTDAGGNTVLNGSVTTSGAQTYNDAVTTTVVNGTTPLQTLTSTTSGGITFNSTLDGTVATAGSRQQLATATTGGSTVFNGAVGSITPFANLTVGGPATVNANITADAPVFNGAVTVTGTRTIATAPVFNNTVAGPGSLTLTGGGTAAAGLGTGTALGALIVNGAIGLTGNVATTGMQAYNGVLTITGDATLSGSTATFNGANSVRPATVGSGNLTLSFTGAQALDGGVFNNGTQGFGSFTVGPSGGTMGATATLTDTTGTFLATNAITLNNVTTLGSNVVLGVSSNTGSVNINGALDAATAGSQGLTINTPGTTNLAATIGGTKALVSLITDMAGTGGTNISADVTANTQNYNDPVTVSGTTRMLTASAGMNFNAGLTGTSTALTLAGTGTKNFGPAAGVVTLGSLTTTGNTLSIVGGGVTTSGKQQYDGGIILNAATVLTGTGASANFTAATIAGGGNALTLDFSGTKALDGSTATGISTLITQGTGTTTLSNTIATSGTQTYNDAVRLGTTTTTVSAGANAITFAATGSVDATAAGAQSLTVNTSGTTTFSGPVGNIAAPSQVTTNSGPVFINVALNPPTVPVSIKTINAQSYGGLVTLGADTVLSAATIGFTSGISGNPGGIGGVDHDLTLTTTGAKSLPGTSLTGIRNLTANGGGAITITGNITTSGTQTYSDATTLNAATVVLTSTGTGAMNNADITFGNTLNATAAGSQGLTTSTAGATYFNGNVGTTALSTINAGATVFGIGTTPAISVTTTGNQTYTGPATLASATALNAAAATIAFGSTVGGSYKLTLNSATTAAAGLGDGTTALGELVANGSLALNNATTNNVTTSAAGGNTGMQTYNGITTIKGNSTLSGVSASFNGGNYSVRPFSSGSGNLALNFTGTQTLAGGVFTDGINQFASITVGPNGGTIGATTTLSGGFVTGTAFTLNNVATLGADTSVTTATAAFNGTIDATTNGVQGLTVTAPTKTTFAANVGTNHPLASLTVNGPVALGTTSNVRIVTVNAGATTGAQSYNGAVTLGSGVTLDAGGSAITFASTVDGNQNLDVASNGVKTFNGNVGATTALATLNTRNSNNGNSGTTVFGASAGIVRTNGSQNYTSGVTVNAPSTVFSSVNTPVAPITFVTTLDGVSTGQAVEVSGAGIKTFGGAVGGAIGGAPTLASLHSTGTGTTQISGASIYTSGTQEYDAAVTLNADVTVKSSSSGASAIKFDSTLDSLGGTARALTIMTPGTTTFGGAVGTHPDPLVSTVALASLMTSTGPIQVNGGAVTTTGAQTYGGLVTLGGGTTFTGNPVNFNGGLTAGSPYPGGSGDYDLTLTEGVAKTVDGSLISGVRNLVVNGGGATTLRNAINTSGNQTYSDAVTLGTATVTTASSGSAGVGSNITFSGTIDATNTVGAGQGLTVNTGGTTTFTGAVGATVALANLTTDTGGSTAINGGLVRTTGAQSYNDAVTIGLNPTQLLSTGVGNIAFASTLDGATSGGQALAVNTGGTTIFNGLVGATNSLASLTTDAPGSTQINGTYVRTAGDQVYNDAVTIGASANLVSTASGTINFASTLNGAASVNPDLTVSTQGATVFGGAVGGTVMGNVKLGSLTTDTGGTTAINGSTVVTNAAQTYNDQVTLGQSTTLTGTTGAFNAGLIGGGNDLTLNFSAPSSLDGTVTGVRNLATDAPGGTSLSGTIVTSGNQTYNDAVTLGAATTLQSNNSAGVGGAITLANTVNGGQSLTVNTNDVTTFGGIVGGSAPLASIMTDAAGTTRIATTAITTSGMQSYNDAVILASSAVLTSTAAGAIGFAKTVDAANDGVQGLSVATTGATTFGGAVGGTATGTTRLASLTTDAGGTTGIAGGTVVTTGGQTYGDPLALTIDTRLTSTANGALTLAGGDGGYLLSLNTGGATQLTGVLGGVTPLNGLALRTGTFSGLTGNRVGTIAASVTSGGLAYDDAAALTVGTVDGLSGIATGTAPTTVSAGGLLTLAANVAAGNTSLTGTGVTQAAGTSVNAGAGTILLDANDGAFTLAGLLTTTNATANAVLLRDAAAATLGNIVTGVGGSTTLGSTGGDNLSGNVTQTAGTTIVTGTVNGTIGGSATLTNANNNIATLGVLSANGLALRDSRAGLTVAGPVNAGTGNLALTLDSGTLALTGTLTATTGTVTLTSGGAISQSGGGIVADTLTGSSTGGASLTAAGNMIAKLAGFTNSGSGGFALNDGRSLTVTADATTAGDLTINAIGLDFTGRTISATGAVTLGGGTGAVTGATATGGTNATVSGASVNLGTVRANNGALAVTATGAGGLTVGTASSTGGAATLSSQGALAVTNSLTAGTGATLTATGAATLAQTTAGGALAVTANGIATSALSKAGTTVTFTSGGGINAAAVQAGTDAIFDANGTATLAAVTAGTSSGITVRALDAAIGGALTASKVSFVNRSPTTVTFKLGDNASAGGFQLSQAEVNQVNAGTLVFDGGAGNVEFGTLAFANAAGSSAVNVLATGRIDVKGAVSGTGSGRLFRLGGTAATTSDKASVIEITANANTGASTSGSLSVGTADLELRGSRIGVGQAAGFLTPIGFDSGATGQSVGTVSTAYVANANSSLYNSTYGGGAYQPTGATLVSAHTLTVRYTDYALFQNTGAVGSNAGVTLGGTPSAPVSNALSIIADGGNNAFALFGTINGVSGSGTALLGAQVISFSGANIANTRVNGCLVGSGAGCLSSVVSQPVLNVFDSSRLNVFRSADDLAVPFDPVVGNNNEALFSGASMIDAPVTGTECAGSNDPSCKQQQDKKAPGAADDKKGK